MRRIALKTDRTLASTVTVATWRHILHGAKRLAHFEKSRSHRDGIVAAVFNRQASLFQVLGMAVENRRHICGHTITENALAQTAQQQFSVGFGGAQVR